MINERSISSWRCGAWSDEPALDAQQGAGMKGGISCRPSRSQPDLLSATNSAQSTITSTNSLATTTSHRQQTLSSKAQGKPIQ